MNNKDLFNAINNIDEQFITDAGKYLRKDDLFSISPDGETIEAGVAGKRMALLKFIAPIAAAFALIFGVAVLAASWNGVTTADPETGINMSRREESAASQTSGADIGDKNTAELPVTVYGPDNKQLCYDDVMSATNGGIDVANGGTLVCGFAYAADRTGDNYNSIDDPDYWTGGALSFREYGYKRLYEGDSFGEVKVKKAESTFILNPADEGFTLAESVLELDGNARVSVYIVTDDIGDTRCFIKGSTKSIPVMNFSFGNAAEPEYYQESYNAVVGEFGYAGEIPAIEISLDDSDRAELAHFLKPSSYREAVVTLSNITVRYNNAGGENDCTVSADCGGVMLKNWNSASSTLSEEDCTTVSELIDAAETVNELQSAAFEINKHISCGSLRVYSELADIYVPVFGGEITEGELQPGMIAAVYDTQGNIAGAFTYRLEQLADK